MLRNNKYISKRGGWKRLALIVLLIIITIVAIVVGVVVGTKKKSSSKSEYVPGHICFPVLFH